jgi:hypothetical protein
MIDRRTLLLIAAAAGGAWPSAASAQRSRKLPPRDETAREPALKRVVDELVVACRAKDADKLARHLNEEVKASFGGDDTPAAFVAEFKKKPALWSELETALKLGGTFMSRTTYAAPYVYSTFPDGIDEQRHLVVLGKDVPVHEKPRDGGLIAQRLTHDIVQRLAPESGVPLPRDWLRIRAGASAPGYVRRDQLRSPIDYRAVIEKRGDRWLLTAFVAGD